MSKSLEECKQIIQNCLIQFKEVMDGGPLILKPAHMDYLCPLPRFRLESPTGFLTLFVPRRVFEIQGEDIKKTSIGQCFLHISKYFN